ncbi:MAG: hypothetical protein U9Q90_00910 [Campylobacterota bacterium]|nr:hypothetical protein [Campylobacterota bacterium]
MNKIIALLFLLIVFYGIYNAKFQTSKQVEKESGTHYATHVKVHKTTHFEDELSRIDTSAYTLQYIIDVINHGSYDLGFSGGVMEGGFAAHDDASKIACYVLEMSGKKCTKPYAKDAEMFYTSICGGCHGNDGKGLGGNYPDLTRERLLGVERREAFLKMKIVGMGK